MNKILADLLLLQKIERNMLALNGEIAFRMGRALARKIITSYNCNSISDCVNKLQQTLEASKWQQ